MTRNEKTLLAFIGVFVACLMLCVCGAINLHAQLDKNTQLLEATKDQLLTAQQDLGKEMKKVLELNEKLELISNDLGKANKTITDLKNTKYELVYLGDFKITYYCDERFNHICGGNGVTASGKPTEVGWTAAADWDVLPNGSIVYISGVGFREIQDVGGSVNNYHIDILVKEHVDALANGVDCEGVWLLAQKGS